MRDADRTPTRPLDEPPSVPGIRIESQLGAGGFGTVFRGRHHFLDVDVAVKVVRSSASDLDGALHEARIMSRLDHPNLLRVLDARPYRDGIYLVMEYMDGGSLAGAFRIPAGRALRITRQLLSGLQALHDAEIVHRDVKPANCLVRTSDKRIKLGDLGIAVELAADTGRIRELAGTLPFMAPELFEPTPRFGPRSDLYALGLSIAALGLDEHPCPSEGLSEIIEWSRQGPRPRLAVERPDWSPPLCSVVQRMMQPEAHKRPSSASEALSLLGAGVAEEADTTSSGPVIGPWIVGAELRSTANWEVRAVTHSASATPGRLSRLRSTGPLGRSNRRGDGKSISEVVMAAAERSSRLEHPNLLRLLDWGLLGGTPWVVTAAHGQRLEEVIEAGGVWNEEDALGLAVALAEVLAYLHRQGLVYQILDPGSVMLGADGLRPLLSWPIYCVPAGSDREEQRVFVPRYSPVETWDSSCNIQPARDLYGLGEVLTFVLSGDTAYELPKDIDVPQLIQRKMSPAPSIRERVQTVTAPTAALISDLLDPDYRQRPSATETARRAELTLEALRGRSSLA